MFGKSSDAGSTDRHGHSIFQQGILVRGEIEAKGEVRFDGRLEGRITVSERLTVGAAGVVTADVEASELIVMGKIEGRVVAHRRLELLKGACVQGDVTTPVLVVEEGVVFHGNSNMIQGESERTDPMTPEAEKEEEVSDDFTEYKTVYK